MRIFGRGFVPSYLKLLGSGELKRRVEEAKDLLKSCTVCPWKCGVDRTSGEKGRCRGGKKAVVASYHPHFGEESPLVGRNGSGTIFFTWCNMRCVFCQNYEISQLGEGVEVEAEDLARFMLHLQGIGCHNINLVSPTHFVPQILEAIYIAAMAGLSIPIVYNTGGYDSVETLKLLDGVVDIYMPDMKYSDPDVSKRLSGPQDYPEVNRAAVKEMHRQVGDLEIEDGIAVRGLLIRHLVLPNGLSGTKEVMSFIAREISKDSYVNIMDQYRPTYKAMDYKEISRRITKEELEEAFDFARKEGLWRFDRKRPFLILLDR
jgi:putative pyruvate formate lyase activating enzyme